MKTSVINIKTDEETKKKAQEMAKELGLTLSAIINAYLKQAVKSGEVHFSTYRMTPYLEKRIEQVEKDIKAGRNLSPGFESADEAIAWLHRNDKSSKP